MIRVMEDGVRDHKGAVWNMESGIIAIVHFSCDASPAGRYDVMAEHPYPGCNDGVVITAVDVARAWNSVGQKPTHPSNHWSTRATGDALSLLAMGYWSQFNERLQINDMSLRYGGLLDFNATWAPPHHEHKSGMNADIYPKIPTAGKWAWIMAYLDTRGFYYGDEVNTSSPHIHFKETFITQ